MKPIILTLFLLSLACIAFPQHSDFIILKKKNNRTVKTYAEGSFLSARMNNGFDVHGYITAIRNDSVYLRQQDIKMFGTEFGSALDTLYYAVGFDYRQILRYNIKDGDQFGRPTGFSVLSAPGLMVVGGVGFLILETVNTIYRKESFSDNNRLLTMGIAAGVAAAGYFWGKAQNNKENKKNKLQVVYVKAGSILK
jgi:hypothetical protein